MKKYLLLLISILGAFLLWQLASRAYPSFILPSPARVWERSLLAWDSGTLANDIHVTFAETLGGFAISALLALACGYLAASFITFRQIVSPYVLALQAIPTLAIAPLLVIWFGNGYTTKVIVAAIIAFLPIFASTLTAFSHIEPTLRMDMKALGGNRLQAFAKLELPAALPGIFSGLKVGLNLALMGAVVGEFVGAQHGLGFLVNLGKGLLDTPLVFVAIFTLIVLGLLLYAGMNVLEKIILQLR